MATNEENLAPKCLMIPTTPGSNGPPGCIFISGTLLMMMSGAQLVTITKA